MKRISIMLTVLCLCLAGFPAGAQGLKSFQLKNGMSVYVWEDPGKSDVFGAVAVRTGSVNEPADYTGLAHYLEHVLFKGTEKIGALDWAAEKPIYEEIIAKYDERASETDPVRKEALNKEINRLTIEEGKISLSQEYSSLIEGMGGTGLNAATTYDYTFYYNTFPAFQINSWLQISSERFIRPVFRAFQSELETVYEEYNRSQDNPSSLVSEFLFAKAFEGHPYARSVIGLPEHLKNPQLSRLIQYYHDWYVPENMALILVGNVETSKIMNRIAATFGKLESRPSPERKRYPDLQIEGRKQYTTKFSQYPEIMLIFNGVKAGDPDELPLEIALSLLTNDSSTGLLDKLVIDGRLLGAEAAPLAFREQGRIIVAGIPSYDSNQRRFTSGKGVEKQLLKAIEEVSEGKFEDWMIESIKVNMCRDFDLRMESNQYKAMTVMDAFVNERDLGEVIAYSDRVMGVTVEDVRRVAKRYLGQDYLAIYNEMGKPNRGSKIKKPDIDPIEPPAGASSLYAKQLRSLPLPPAEGKYVDWSEVEERPLNDYSTVYYTKNTESEVYTLLLQYGVGSHVFPKLGYAAALMENAGIMGGYEPEQLKEELAKLHATCSISADDSYLYITLRGYENTLREACMLVTRQMLMPALDEDGLNALIGSVASSRMVRRQNVQLLADALNEYIKYGDKSEYRQELTDEEILNLDIATLTGDITRATHYASEIFYSGTLPFDEVYSILSTSLPLVAGEKPSASPYLREMKEYKENTVYFLPNVDARQSQIYFYIPMGDYRAEEDVRRMAFSQYIDGGFNGLIMNEIREKNSMAYTAYGEPVSRALPGSRTYFTGYIGSQNDKALGAIALYMDILQNMPEHPERIGNIKDYLRQVLMTSRPGVRSLGQTIARWKRQGCTEDPAIRQVQEAEALTFQDIVDYYHTYVQGKPVIIGVLGNPKEISASDLSAFGKVIRISEKDLFNDEDRIF